MSDLTPSAEQLPLEGDDAVIGRALRWSLLVFVVLGGMGVVVWLLRPDPPAPVVSDPGPVELPQVRQAGGPEVPAVTFRNVSAAAGLDFVHENGAFGQKLLPETMGGGCGFWDFDNDGDQDIVLVNSRRWTWDERPPGPPARLAVYQNDGSGRFQEVAADVGLDVECYGMGVAFGDYDNDGRVDLFVSAVGRNRLFRNLESGFVEVTEDAAVGGAEDAWSTSCGWFDYDRDGDLDLFVCNYVQWSRELDIAQDFRLTGIGRAYGPPTSFAGAYPYLYRNDGDGRFTEVSEAAGLRQVNEATGVPLAKSLGLAPVDLDGDGWIDIVVANDTVRNLVFRNRRDGTFDEIGMLSGVAYDSSGKARGAMGIDAAPFRDDGSLGIAIANFANEMTALYVSSGQSLLFTDDAIPTGLGPATRLDLSFGLFFFDYDLDCRLDLFAANGHLENEIHVVQESQQYRQPPRLFWNAGEDAPTEFVRVPGDKLGSEFEQPVVGRGAAYGDIDGDGDLDVLMTQIAGPPTLLRNDQQLGHHFVRLKLQGTTSNRDAIGAWILVEVADRTLRRQVMPTRSYLSQVELPVTIGLGMAERPDKVTVVWPDGSTQTVPDVVVDGLTRVVQPES